MIILYNSVIRAIRPVCQNFSNPISPCLNTQWGIEMLSSANCWGTKQHHRKSNGPRSRSMSTNSPRTMKAWQALQYGGPEQLQFTDSASVPTVRSPEDVLVKVFASSVNPIDVRMLGGYGKATLNTIRLVQRKGEKGTEFPLVLGRDFAGEVVGTGRGVSSSQLKVGDKVWGVTSPFSTLGSHAEFTLSQMAMVSRMPLSLTNVEAASFPYASMTLWSAACVAGGMSQRTARGKRVLILGASGGIGTLAVQLLKAWEAEVTAVAMETAENLLMSLGADIIIDYQQPSFKEDLNKVKGFDLILNLVPGDTYEWATSLLKKACGAKFVTLNFPLLANNDKLGVPLGIAKSLLDLSKKAVPSLPDGQFYRWAVFAPSQKALKTMDYLIQQGKMRPVVGTTFPFSELPAAYDHLQSEHNQGKVTIDHMSSSS